MKDKKFTPEEIAESLRVCAGTGCKGCVHPGCGEELCMNALNKIAADMLEELAAEVTRLREGRRWIPTSERLPYPERDTYSTRFPDEDIEVLVMIKGGKVPTALRFNDEGEFYAYDDNGSATFYPVTHWMPMPKGPEVGHD